MWWRFGITLSTTLVAAFNSLAYEESDYTSLACTSTSPFNIYDPTKILNGCNSCPLKLTSGSADSCVCSPGFRQIGCVATPDPGSCAVYSFDGTFCTTCPFGTFTTTLKGVSVTLCSCPAGSIYRDRNPATGAPLTTGTCSACPEGYYPNSDLSTCLACPDVSKMTAELSTTLGAPAACQCKKGLGYVSTPLGGTCVNSPALQTAMGAYGSSPGSVRLASGSSIQSDPFNYYFLYAVTNCDTYGDLTACQVLANLCTMALYNQGHSSCSAYRTIARKSQHTPVLQNPYNDQPRGLPWLFWGLLTGETSIQILARIPTLTVSISHGAPPINFRLGIYRLNGTFVGFQPLTTQFQMCSGAESELKKWNEAGMIFNKQCTINILSTTASHSETLFYEIFLVQTDGSLYPIPVRIMNAQSGPDPYPTTLSLSTSSYNRRFTLVDVDVGREGGTLNHIRVPTSIQFWIKPVGSNYPGQIYVPVLDVTYTDIPTSALPMQKSFQFSSTYINDYYSAYNTVQILAAIFGSFVVIFAFYQARSFNQRNGGVDAIDLGFLGRFGIQTSGHLSTSLFWFLFALSVYLLLFYKTQGVLFVVVPSYPVDVNSFSLALGIAALLKGLQLLKSLLDQCQVEIFFLDWEQAKTAPPENLYDQPKPVPVSVWRSIFMSNEWAKLQVYRFCSIEFCLLGVLVLLEGFQWKFAGTAKPNLYDLSDGVMNPILMCAIDVICWIILIVSQKVFRYIFYDRYYKNKVAQFIDIMALSNISLLLFDEKCHGYYIHGKSVHSTADTNLEELNNCLQKEANDMVPRRGLQDSNEQSFEIFVTSAFRDLFEKIYRPTEGETARTMVMMNKLSLVDGSQPKFQEYKAAIGQTPSMARTYKVMTKFLHAFFNMNLKEYPYSIRTKTFVEVLIGATADTHKGSVLMPDLRGVTNCTLLGLENDLLVFYMSLFTFIHITSFNTLYAALAVWIIDIALTFIRIHLGDKNIAQKALLDPKFLL